MNLYCLILRRGHNGIEVLTRTSFSERRYDVPNDACSEEEDPHQAAVRITTQQTGIVINVSDVLRTASWGDDYVCSVMVSDKIPDRFSYTMPDTQCDIAEFHYRWLPVDAMLPSTLVEPAATYVSKFPLMEADSPDTINRSNKLNLRQRFSDSLVHIWGNWPIPQWARTLVVRIIEPKYLAGVVGIIFDDRDYVLLARHTYRKEFPWAPPSGWIKRGEDPTQALEREVYEETGYRIWVGGAIAVGGDKDMRRLDLYYRCALLGGEFRPCAEVSEAQLCAVDALPEDMEPFHREVIDYAIKRPGAALPPRAN